MDWTKTNIRATLDFTAQGKQIGDLRLPWSGNEQPLGYHPVPVAVLKNGTGPTLLLAGGTHGDEYEGPAALMQLLHSFNPAQLQGRLIIFPVLNTPAVTAGARCSPLDDGNLNRAFPGNRSGGPTSMIAQFIEDVVLPECDAAIDFHSGGNACVFAPLTMVYLGAGTADKQASNWLENLTLPIYGAVSSLNKVLSMPLLFVRIFPCLQRNWAEAAMSTHTWYNWLQTVCYGSCTTWICWMIQSGYLPQATPP